MSDRLYVRETTEEDEEGHPLTIVQAYDSKPNKFSYIVWLDK